MEQFAESGRDTILEPRQTAAALIKFYHERDEDSINELLKLNHDDQMSPYVLLMATLTITDSLVGYMSRLMGVEPRDVVDTILYSNVT